jgi:FkbM family methyltransferase
MMSIMPLFRNQLVRSPNEFLSRSGYLMRIYAVLLYNALKQSRASRKDFSALLFMFIVPVFYVLGVKIVKSPFGILLIADRETLRSFVYGFFKTHFYYVKDLKKLLGKLHFSVVLDVGANIGDFTLGTARMADKIIAVEPGKRNFSALETNLTVNGIENVIAVNAAATDTANTVFMQGNTSDLFVTNENCGEEVEGFTIDKIVQENCIDKVDVVKLDVQGHELPVLIGMRQLLTSKLAKLLIIEVHLKRNVTTDEVVSIMDRYGYKVVHEDHYLFEQPHLYFVPKQ